MLDAVYLDHAATTPMLPQAIEALTQELGQVGNASSLHNAGRRARRVVEESRERIAAAMGARPGEVIFTSGGTEADNLAIKGIYWARQVERARPAIAVSAIEHHAVMDPVEWLESQGAHADWLPVTPCGEVRLDGVKQALSPETALATVMWANNEVGTIQPIAEVVALAAEHGIPVHSDAVQAVGHIPVNFANSGLDALTFTAHKLGGPYGVGALIAKRELKMTPLLHGGGQERDVRSGTLDTPAIAAFAVATEIAVRRQETEAERLRALRDELVRRVRALVPEAIINGDEACSRKARLPGNAHIKFPGCEGDSLLMLLDHAGISCSTGSACTAGVPQPSHVLMAMGADRDSARSSLRFSLGHTSTLADVDALAAAIGPAYERARAAGIASGFGGDSP